MFENLVQICPSSFRAFTPVDEIINVGTAANMRLMRVMKYFARPRLEPCTQKTVRVVKNWLQDAASRLVGHMLESTRL